MREPLLLEGAESPIGSIEPELALRLVSADLPLRQIGPAWQVTGPPDAGLAHLARWLNANGLGSRWRDELLAVHDADDHPAAVIERAAVRPLGIATAAVHLVGHTAGGKIWIQQRALDKATDPGLWDTLMGGLMSHAETIATTLERETWEEAGLELAALNGVAPFGDVIVRRPVADGYMIERIHCYEAEVPAALEPRNQDGEVERFDCVDPSELRSRLQANHFTLEAALVLARWLEQRGIA